MLFKKVVDNPPDPRRGLYIISLNYNEAYNEAYYVVSLFIKNKKVRVNIAKCYNRFRAEDDFKSVKSFNKR